MNISQNILISDNKAYIENLNYSDTLNLINICLNENCFNNDKKQIVINTLKGLIEPEEPYKKGGKVKKK
jgi:hypothetical protein